MSSLKTYSVTFKNENISDLEIEAESYVLNIGEGICTFTKFGRVIATITANEVLAIVEIE